MTSKVIKALRINEVSLMTGFFVIGGIFAMDDINAETLLKLFWLCLLSFSTVLSIYSFNAAAGIRDDGNNLRLQNLWGIKSKYFLGFAVLSFLVSMGVSLILNTLIPAFTLIIIFIWILYSHPAIGLKRKAIWGTVIHFLGQVLHFNMAYLAFSNLGLDSVLISVFFALAFSSGHLLHEIIDYDADFQAGLKTSAVKFGIGAIRNTGIIILSLNVLLIIALFISGIIEVAFYCFIIPAITHLLLFVVFNKDISSKALFIRTVYRIVYFAGGAAFLLLSMFRILT
ncbi:MAG TPA: UbiA family prenyltransferase [Bacteroidales bacterium]|nr:UbiA family prenyltransferase [Bacteroidales bacterium]HQL69758.1 UbiA family prenyltransferase [Bacteroidales bacterium]